ncbi:glycine/D-amino acid oxidase-like deaminating enzyme [Algoriphagus boseongensis]|uniref:Glycine/D-amino acid oxidase-like deaminating enzyme n=1 Tax=Algoriphagus boseongensis TaxID=1442587 RepID=A0A4R6T480_9BACT|nr:FAD-dependent oxidoreductase [Algoriphagus boseongensis]TDQ16487.1 glycine/D-amino acid oxidase-like deaminating enzyme [Algoriphagus boseongensis]
MDLLWAMELDFLLIGQGLAGTALAYRLEQAGMRILILDQPEKNQSSRVAAGLYNPVTGKKMVKSWIAEKLFPELEQFYIELEQKIGSDFLIEKNIYRPFLSIEEQNEWMGHSSDPLIHLFIEEIFTESQHPELRDPFGGVLLKKSGWLDIPTYLEGMAKHFGEKLKLENFEEELLEKTSNGWNYKDFSFRGIIYCNGLAAMKSRFFSFLPFAPVKGEILEVEQDFDPAWIINRGVFRVPLEEGVFRVGSTYTWHDLEIGPTESAKNELITKLEHLVRVPIKSIKSHRHGIRPATKDRKPFLGKHPIEAGVYIFNGFGAKGVSLTPYFSAMMRDFLIENRPLDTEVDIKRYFKYI